jgi:hypothetical protein
MSSSGRWATVLVLAGMLLRPAPLAGQVSPPNVTTDPCPEPNNSVANACRLGQPNAMGTTVQGAYQSPDDVDVYRFDVPAGGAQAYVSLTDIWYESGLRLFDVGRGQFIADSDRQGQAQGQLHAPEVIVRWLEGGSYALFVSAGPQSWATAEAYSYTLRVALGPRTASPAGAGPAPSSAQGYQLTLSIEPSDPGPFSLMTFTAVVNPPFTDLFDFSWSLDGQPIGENYHVVQFPRPSSGPHTVLVVARGARQYPDRSLPEFPPTLSATGSFAVR